MRIKTYDAPCGSNGPSIAPCGALLKTYDAACGSNGPSIAPRGASLQNTTTLGFGGLRLQPPDELVDGVGLHVAVKQCLLGVLTSRVLVVDRELASQDDLGRSRDDGLVFIEHLIEHAI